MLTYLGAGFMLYPVADSIEFESSDETGKADAELVNREWVQFFQSIRLSHHVKRRLSELRAFESGG